MKRSEFIQKMSDFLDTFPEGCSNYHICDMLIGYAEKQGMQPPTHSITMQSGMLTYGADINEWEKEDD